MKILLLIFIGLLFSLNIYSQTFTMSAANNNTTQTSCNATLYDSGGPSGTYQNSESYTITFCSGNTNCLQVSFSGTFNLESGYDYLNIYDGNTTGAPLLISLNGSTLPGTFTTSGTCVTFRFTSDGSVTYDGFQATITCTPNCYVPPPPPTNIDPCSATLLTVNANCVYTQYTNVSAPGSAIAMPSCSWSYSGGDVWFQTVVPASGLLTIQVGPGVITQVGIAIYTGPDCNNLTELLCNEPWAMPVLMNIQSTYGLAGQAVWVRIWEQYNDNPGTFDICAFEPPPSMEVDNITYTPQQLVTDILVTGCLQALNVVYTGDPLAIGYFFNAFGVGIQEGVIMSSGYVAQAIGNGSNTFASASLTTNTGDALLNAIVTPDVTTDVTILEFDFIPAGDTLKFDFIFGSEEYPEYVFSFNDVFAFFLSGPNPLGGNYTNYNIALIPGTATPVSIYNVNNGSGSPPTGPCVNCSYYVDNWAGTHAITYDGYTTPITAEALVTPCQTYHIKLAVADVNDMAFDSAVLLKAGSFSSGGQVSMSHYSSNGASNEVIEGCDNYWVFGRVDTMNTTDSILVDLVLSGTGSVSTDLSSFVSTFYIPAGQIYDTLYYSAIMDNIPEGVEYIVFSLTNGCPCSSTTTSDTIWIHDNYNLNPTITPNNQICSGNNFVISTTVNSNIDPSYITYLWDDGSTTSSITDAPTATTTYTVTITHTCFPDTTLSMTVTVIPDLGAGFSLSDYDVCIGAPVTVTFTDTAGVNANYSWTFTNGNPSSGSAQGPYNVSWASAGTYDVSLHVDDSGCIGDSTVQVTIFPNPTVSFTPVDASCFGSCDGEITANPLGTAAPYTYLWNDPSPQQTTQTAIALCAGNYSVTFTDSNGCTGTASSSVSQPTLLTATASSTNEICFGQGDGSVTVTVSGGTTAYTYLWSDGGTAQTQTGMSPGNYSVTVTDQNGCTAVSSATVNGPLQPLISSISGTDISCFGYVDGTVNLEASGGTIPYSYTWNSGQTSQDLNNVPAGTYNVTVSDFNGCTSTQTITLTSPTQITYTTSTTPATCFGGTDGNASIVVSNGTPPYTFFWSNGGLGASINNVTPDNYSVTVTDNSGCTISTSMTVDEPDKVIASVGQDRWICIGETTTLNASATGGTPGYVFQWCHGPFGSSIDVSPVVTTQYCVKAIDTKGCESGLKYVTVFVYQPVSVDVSADKYEICVGDAVELNAVANGGNGNYTYTLTNNGNQITLPYTVYPQSSMTFEILASDNCGSPTDQASVDIIVNPLPPVSFMPDTTQGCEPLTVNFIEISPDNNQTYNWNFGDDNSYNTSGLKAPQHTYEYDGLYTVTLTVTSEKGCKNTKVIADLITVYPIPDAKFAADPEVASVIKPIVYFENLSTGAINYHWMFGDGDSSLNVNPYHQYAAVEGVYFVELRVESEYGCKDTIFNTVIIRDEYAFYAPTAFSPDNDLVNDEFFVSGHGIDAGNFLLIIYDRWGEVIFDTDKPDDKWNGRAKNGNKLCPTGTYTWYVKFKDVQGIEREESGAVTIIR